MIPNTWKLVIAREAGMWKGTAEKQEGRRTIEVSTYDSPSATFQELMTKLEERIKE